MARADVTVPGGAGAVRRAARQILSRPEFRPTPESPLQRLRNWIGRELTRLAGDVLNATPHGVLGAIIVVAVVAALVALTVSAVRATGADPARPGYAVDRVGRLPADWLAQAARHEAAGEWRAALRCRYRALVAELARRGVVDEIPGRTTGEYRRAIDASLPSGADQFAGATELFELVWYGDQPGDAAATSRFRALAEGVLEGAR